MTTAQKIEVQRAKQAIRILRQFHSEVVEPYFTAKYEKAHNGHVKISHYVEPGRFLSAVQEAESIIGRIKNE